MALDTKAGQTILRALDREEPTSLLHSSLNGGPWVQVLVAEKATMGSLEFESPIALAPDDWLTLGILTPEGVIEPMVSVHGRNAETIKGLTLFGSPRPGA